MIFIKYCDVCEGKPYYDMEKDSTHYICPFCYHELKDEVCYDAKELKAHIKMEDFIPKTIKENRRNALFTDSKADNIEQEISVQADVNIGKGEDTILRTDIVCGETKAVDHVAPAHIVNESKNREESKVKDRTHERRKAKDFFYEGEENIAQKQQELVKKEKYEVQTSNEIIRPEYIADVHKVQGKIAGLDKDDGYHRTFLTKVFEKIRYGQRVSDILNTIIVKVTDTNGNNIKNNGKEEVIAIKFHGAVNGGLGNSLLQSQIVAEGTYIGNSKKEFYARNIYIEGNHKQVEAENGDVLFIAIPVMIIAFIIFLFTLIPEGMSLGEAIIYAKNRVITFIGIDFVLSILSTSVLYFRTRRRLMQIARGMRPIRFRTCLATGVAVSTVLSIILMFII